MLKFLKGVVAGSGTGIKDLPYNIGEPYPSAWGSWTHHRGTSKDDGSAVSIFCLSGSSAQDGHLAAGRNGVKRLRTVRHPNILSFLHSTELETFDASMSRVTLYMVTEPVIPLSEKIKELGLEGTQRDEYYAWGLNQIAKAVSFLNNDCKLVMFMVMFACPVLLSLRPWTGSCTLSMSYQNLMEAMQMQLGQCCNSSNGGSSVKLVNGSNGSFGPQSKRASPRSRFSSSICSPEMKHVIIPPIKKPSSMPNPPPPPPGAIPIPGKVRGSLSAERTTVQHQSWTTSPKASYRIDTPKPPVQRSKSGKGGGSSSGKTDGDENDGAKPKLKPLHWDKVRASSDHATS
ncbi:N-terminal kinase-like protein [Linum perenne]